MRYSFQARGGLHSLEGQSGSSVGNSGLKGLVLIGFAL